MPVAELRWDAPERAGRMAAGKHRISGSVRGGLAPALMFRGEPVALDRGRFNHPLTLEPGLNLLALTVRDAGGEWTAHRGVLVGADADPAAVVPRAAQLTLGPDALARLAELAAREIDQTDMVAAMNRGGAVRVTRFRSDPAVVEIAGQDGGLQVVVTLPNTRAHFRATKSVLGASLTATGSVNARAARTTLAVDLAIEAGQLVVAVKTARLRFDGFDLHLDYVPRAIENWVRGEVRRSVQKAAERALERVVEEPLRGVLDAPRRFEVFGQPIEARLTGEQLLVSPEGVALSVGVALQATGDPALRPLWAERPGPWAVSGLGADLSVDVVNRLLHTVWAKGLFNQSLRGDELAVLLDVDALEQKLGVELSELAEPLRIQTEALTPPVARVEREQLNVVLSDLRVTLADSSGPLLVLALRATVGVRLAFEALAAQPEMDLELALDLVDAPRVPVAQPQVAALGELLSPLLARLLPVDTIVVPVPDGLAPTRAALRLTPSRGWAGLRGDYDPGR